MADHYHNGDLVPDPALATAADGHFRDNRIQAVKPTVGDTLLLLVGEHVKYWTPNRLHHPSRLMISLEPEQAQDLLDALIARGVTPTETETEGAES